MRTRFHGSNATFSSIQRLTERETKVLDRRLAHVAEDLKLLDVSIDHRRRDDNYTAKLVLKVLDRVLVARSTGETREMALRSAFAEMNGELDEFLAKLRGEPEIRDEQRKPSWLGQPGSPPK